MIKILLTFALVFSLYASENDVDEFSLGEITNGNVSKESYFNNLNIPNVYVTSTCLKNCKGDNCCWRIIKNQTGKTIKSFSSSDSVSGISKGRYKDIAYLYYSRTHGSKKNRKTDYHLIDQDHKEYETPIGSSGLANIISKDAKFISISNYGVYENGKKILDNDRLETVAITNNPSGDIAIAAVVANTNEVLVTNLSKWMSTNILLSKHGDRSGILSVYPKDKNNIYSVTYKNVNIYNKGLMGAITNFESNTSKQGWIFNSAQRNVGFDPSIYTLEDTLHIGTEDSTNRTNVHITIDSKEYEHLGNDIPEHIFGFENESIVDLLVGTGLSQTYWNATSSIDGMGSDSSLEYGEVKYDIGKSFYKSLYFEGRFDSTNISIAYLENEAREKGGLVAKASKLLNTMVDFQGLISDSSTLRLKITKGNINGIATFIDNNNGSTALPSSTNIHSFSSQLETYGAYAMMERGYFGGLEYTQYTTPSAIGFSDVSKNLVLYGMDNNFKIKTFSLVLGYDEISYAKRYEVNLSRSYFQGNVGLGWSDYTLSSEAKNAVYLAEPTKTINYTGSFNFSAELEYGYIFQERFKTVRGLGYSLTAGYKARMSFTGSGQDVDDEDSSIGDNELELEMSRFDLWHGPYVSANLIF